MIARSNFVCRHSRSSPFALTLPPPNLPIAPLQVSWSVPTRALKSPNKISLFAVGTLARTPINYRHKASLVSSECVTVGAYTIMIVMRLFRAILILIFIILSEIHLGASLNFLARLFSMAKTTPALLTSPSRYAIQ